MAKTFSVAKKGGYDAQEVDEHIAKLEKELDTYRQREQMISQAIMDAQITAKKIIKGAKDEANQIQKDALLQMDSIRRKVSYIKQKIGSFQTSYNQFIERFTININHDDIDKLYHQLDELADSLKVNDSQTPTPSIEGTVPNIIPVQNNTSLNPTPFTAQTLSDTTELINSTQEAAVSKDTEEDEKESPFMGMGGFNSNLFTID